MQTLLRSSRSLAPQLSLRASCLSSCHHWTTVTSAVPSARGYCQSTRRSQDLPPPPPPPPPPGDKQSQKQGQEQSNENKDGNSEGPSGDSEGSFMKIALIWFLGGLGLGYLGVDFSKLFPDLYEKFEKIMSKEDKKELIADLAELQGKVTDRVFLDFQIDQEPPERVVIGLYGDECPKTTENFKTLCAGKLADDGVTTMTYKDCSVHRIIPGFMLQSGDYTRGDGTGGRSIYGGMFADESFKYKHTGLGVVSMANRGRDTNSSQFFICFSAASWLNGKHVVFGQVMHGINTLQRIERCGTRSGSPLRTVRIIDCGVLPPLEETLVMNNDGEEVDEMGHNVKRIMK